MQRTLKIAQARYAIEDIIFRYADAVDRGDMETVGDLLHACIVQLTDGTRLEGGAAIADHYRRIIRFYDADENVVDYQPGRCTPRTRHVTTNLFYEFSAPVTSARVQSYFTVYQTLAHQCEIIAGGRYIDRFAYTTSGWRLEERQILVDNRGDMGRHIKNGTGG